MLNTEELFNMTGFNKKQWLKAETTNVKLGIIFNTEETNYQVHWTILHYLEFKSTLKVFLDDNLYSNRTYLDQ